MPRTKPDKKGDKRGRYESEKTYSASEDGAFRCAKVKESDAGSPLTAIRRPLQRPDDPP